MDIQLTRRTLLLGTAIGITRIVFAGLSDFTHEYSSPFIQDGSIMKKIAFYSGRLFNGIRPEYLDNQLIVVSGNKIEQVLDYHEGLEKEFDQAINLNRQIILPGLIDMHVHITVPFMTRFNKKEAILAIEPQRELNFKSCIKYGITTVRDMGAFPNSIQKWKKKIEGGQATGPRIFTPNSFITSKDGPPERAPRLPFPVDRLFGGQLAERVSTPYEVRNVALRNIANGADFLKTSYAEESMFFNGKLQNLSDACFHEIRRMADQYHLKVAMHHTEKAGFRKGIEHHFDCLEHCALDPLDAADIDAFVAQNMAIIPTLRVNRSSFEGDETLAWLDADGKADYAEEPLAQIRQNWKSTLRKPYPPDHQNPYLDMEKSKKGYEVTVRNLANIKKAGGRIGVGTDSFGCYLNLPGFFWKELLLLKDAGFSEWEILSAATHGNAEILGVDQQLGSIQPGKLADFVVVDGDPASDLAALQNISLVVKDGEIYKGGEKVLAV
jgi:imidazolonepropionase-like amidohydrolase